MSAQSKRPWKIMNAFALLLFFGCSVKSNPGKLLDPIYDWVEVWYGGPVDLPAPYGDRLKTALDAYERRGGAEKRKVTIDPNYTITFLNNGKPIRQYDIYATSAP